jgi:glucose-1-phosphate thymidylyltransferase
VKAIIPAAGIGTRLRPHTHSLPKALLYVAGRPIISHILEDVRRIGPSSVVLIVGYKGELVREYVEREYKDLNAEFIVQEERLGIGHAVNLTRRVADTGEPALIILGDTILRTDLEKVVASRTNILGVKEVEDPRRFGVCEVRGKRILKLVEKPKDPPSNLALVGLYYLRDSALLFEVLGEQISKDIRNHGEYQITDALQMMIDRGSEFETFQVEEWFDCGKYEAMLETNRRLLEGKFEAPRAEGSVFVPPLSVAPTARIVNSIIGPHVSIAADAVVENAIVRDSIIDHGANVRDCLLQGSIIGPQTVIKGSFQRLNIGDSSEVTYE